MGTTSRGQAPAEIVERGYDAVAERYLDWSAGSKLRERWLEDLRPHLPLRAKVLDLGCGAGVPVAKLLSDGGSDVLGVDLSPRQIELARSHVPTAEFREGDIASIDFETGSFDAVVALYSITHVPRALHQELFKRVYRWLVPGGVFLASLGTRDLPAWTGEWLGTTMFFSHFDAPTNLRLLERAGLTILKQEIVGEHEHGQPVEFLWVEAVRPLAE